MGSDIGELFEKIEVTFDELKGMRAAIDGHNIIYQFLSSIRQPDGTPLMDRNGNITSHLTGIIYRFTNLIEVGIRPIFVFDGKPPDLKAKTIEKRREVRNNAELKWDEAKERGDLEDAMKYAKASTRITPEIIQDAKELLGMMGIPWIDAPSEGEAQAVYLLKNGDCDFVGSQDFDSLLFGADRLVRNLATTGKRKIPGKKLYVDISPEEIWLEENLKRLGITQQQLIDIGILVGTDFNEGVKGVGPKTALKLIKQEGTIEKVLDLLNVEIGELDKVKAIFTSPEVRTDYEISESIVDEEGLFNFLCVQHDFSRDRIEKAISRLKNANKGQMRLDKWF
ncbi:MAG: flap endonuclease 1 [Candidatus Syntrophoarchaeum caldarius]|uniref:Flap endonuclease 1 n=1 Tax=Candidatus Syntropharchaeum caldarium TaxID=1838285 RepID=A0A1F2PAE6_9EURY|nr:MAG: flap endonuclease 1 [Candidatus Syntrophoarchaeum caldarius]